MPYTLITAKGKIYTFYVLAVAEVYQVVEGGQIITSNLLVDIKSQLAYNSSVN